MGTKKMMAEPTFTPAYIRKYSAEIMQLNCPLQNSGFVEFMNIVKQTWVGITVYVSSNSVHTRIAPGQHPLMARTVLFQSLCFQPFTQSETVVHRVIVYFAF